MSNNSQRTNRMIYLASPYKHEDPIIQAKRHAMACCARDYYLREGQHVYSPIAHNHNSINLPSSWAFWREFDLDMLSRCDYLWILSIDGWEKSVGVTEEIKYFSHTVVSYFSVGGTEAAMLRHTSSSAGISPRDTDGPAGATNTPPDLSPAKELAYAGPGRGFYPPNDSVAIYITCGIFLSTHFLVISFILSGTGLGKNSLF